MHGLVPKLRRRTPGLRREELADLAGISTTWYVRLEQARDVKASLHALDRIGKALKLDASEQSYLLQLARPDLDWKSRVRSHETPSQALLAIVAGLSPHPAYVLTKYWQVKACNHAARLLFGDLDNEAEWGANLVARLFLDEAMRVRFVDWAAVTRSVVAQLRLSTASMAGDSIMTTFITQLSSASPEFRSYWDEVELSEAPLWRKTIRHPATGPLHFDFAALAPPGPDRGFLLTVHTPSDQATARAMERLLAS